MLTTVTPDVKLPSIIVCPSDITSSVKLLTGLFEALKVGNPESKVFATSLILEKLLKSNAVGIPINITKSQKSNNTKSITGPNPIALRNGPTFCNQVFIVKSSKLTSNSFNFVCILAI